jgi:hypothetical protein
MCASVAQHIRSCLSRTNPDMFLSCSSVNACWSCTNMNVCMTCTTKQTSCTHVNTGLNWAAKTEHARDVIISRCVWATEPHKFVFGLHKTGIRGGAVQIWIIMCGVAQNTGGFTYGYVPELPTILVCARVRQIWIEPEYCQSYTTTEYVFQ